MKDKHERKALDISPAPDPSRARAANQSEAERAISARASILFFFAVTIALYLAWHLLKELEILYVSALFAVVLTPVVDWICGLQIRSWRPPRVVGILVLILGVVSILTLFFVVALPPVITDLRSFVTDLPQRLPKIVAHLRRFPQANRLGLDTLATRVQGAIEASAGYLITSLPMWLSHIFDLLTTAFLTIYFMLEGNHAFRFFLSLFDPAPRERLDQTLCRAKAKMSKWLLGQGLLMAILGTASTIAFGVFHLRYFVLLGVLMGLFNIIPIAGAVVTMSIVSLVAALDSWTKMFEVIGFYLVYLNVENAILTPRIMKSSVDISGLTVLVALLFGSALAGIVGALVAVPTAALIVVLLEEYAVKPA